MPSLSIFWRSVIAAPRRMLYAIIIASHWRSLPGTDRARSCRLAARKISVSLLTQQKLSSSQDFLDFSLIMHIVSADIFTSSFQRW